MVHPSRAIRGGKSQLLAGRRIVVGISGSIAAIEMPRVIRELIRHGAEVRAVMSPDAARIVTPETIAFATGNPPIVQLSGEVEHVTLMGPGEGRADLLLLAPATANTISKIAHGIDDTAVTSFATVALGGGVPVLVAPAMHAHMGQNPAIRENLDRLRSWGVEIIAPLAAEGEEKLATPEEISAAVLHRLARGPWAGRRVIVIGGAARESIDSVRSLTNESSGETAVQLAVQAYFRGAQVELWASPLEVAIPSFLPLKRWRSVGDLRQLIRSSPEPRNFSRSCGGASWPRGASSGSSCWPTAPPTGRARPIASWRRPGPTGWWSMNVAPWGARASRLSSSAVAGSGVA